jgi:hypothetical protein
MSALKSPAGRLFITNKSSKCRFLNDTGSHLCVFPRKIITQRRSHIHYNPHLRMTASWPQPGIMPGPHVASFSGSCHNLSLQDTDEELQTLMASNIALRFMKQIPGTTVSTYCDMSAGQSRPYVSDSLCLQVFES